MALELFEHFLRTEVSRHPSLGTALQVKANLRRCSKQFERTVAELHYKLIKAAVQQLFSRVSTLRLHDLSSEVSSSCETKYVITDSSQGGTPNSRSLRNEQPSTRWDAQSNNSQGHQRQPSAFSATEIGVQQRQMQNSGSCSWNRPYDARRLLHQEHQSPGCQQQSGCQQPRNQNHASAQPEMFVRSPTNQKPQGPPRPQQAIREAPTYSYPKMNNPNRVAMAGWYVANMDALLSNLMRVFELIYRDTLQMCGVTQCDLTQLRNALPDPTLISMQQRSTGAWRPNFMNCKIDFLLHLAAMVYRNTQDIKCGCQCSFPSDPCQRESLKPSAPPHIQVQPSTLTDNAANRWLPRHQPESNRNNAAASAVSYCATCKSWRAPMTSETVKSVSATPYCENLTLTDVTPLEALETVVHSCSCRQLSCPYRSSYSWHRNSSRSRHRSPSCSNSTASSKGASNNDNNRSGSCRRGRGRSRRLAARLSGGGIYGFGGGNKRQEFAEVLVSRAEVASDDESSDTETGRTCLSVDIKMPH